MPGVAIFAVPNRKTDEKNRNEAASVAKKVRRLNILPQRRCSRIHKKLCGGLRVPNRFVLGVLCWFVLVAVVMPVFAQTETARVSGQITDASGRNVPKAEVRIVNLATGVASTAASNDAGIYSVAGLIPGRYRITVQKEGFREVIVDGLVVNVQDVIAQNVQLQIGSVSETVTVTADDLHMNTTDASVSTVVDRQFAENLPLNGRSFQSLIYLTPGVVPTASTFADAGQFSVNGQRGVSNYWMVDGVSANVGIGVSLLGTPSNGLAGALGSFNAQGGTNSLVSVDALQEFRIQTSTYAPEYGRTPGGQISIATRSGTNQFHGTAFDYFRNEALDANDWFADRLGLPKPAERQNDFGGTLSGPLHQDRTFFFFSYEGLRLALPQVALTDVPDIAARQGAIPAMQPFFNAFPLPNGPDNPATGIAQLNASFANRSTLDAYSLRIDHRFNKSLSVFGRYNYSPSETLQRGAAAALNTISPTDIALQTATVGTDWLFSPTIVNDFRFNYSRANAHSYLYSDTFAGAVPLASLPFPAPFTSGNGLFQLGINNLAQGFLDDGINGHQIQRQINIVDSLSLQTGSHSLKFGVDYRRLSPQVRNRRYTQTVAFNDVPSTEAGMLSFSFLTAAHSTDLLFRNLGLFAQDTWAITPRLTMTYGLRWDIDFTPASTSGPSLPAVTGYDLSNLSSLALAPAGTPSFATTYGNVAPRIGAAYRLRTDQKWQTVLRGGFGTFFDLVSSEVGNTNFELQYPFGAGSFNLGGTFPLSGAAAALPPITPNNVTMLAFDPHLRLPYVFEWNVAIEQAMGSQQALTISYIGSTGRRLLRTVDTVRPNPTFLDVRLIGNTATSDYDALQLQFQRRLATGLQMLSSYTFSHSIDTASAGSYGNGSNLLVDGSSNRGPSDFDIRHAFSSGITYDVPAPKMNGPARAFLAHWSLETILQARSAPPVDVFNGNFSTIFHNQSNVRPDLVAGIPLYLDGPQFPGGRAINNTPGAVPSGCPDGSASVGPFCPPPIDANGNALRQGNLGRNALRAFAAAQWDFAVHRDFPLRESLKLQLRAEMFNVLNHPNFGPPVNDISNTTQFGQATQMLGRSLNQNIGGGSFSSLYQVGGPRSVQLALKLSF
jgi:Carboxypeptidase regulatory-like domain/TonB dependent receptor